MLFSPSSLSCYSSLDYFGSVVARQQELFRDRKKSRAAVSHAPLCWAQKMHLLGGGCFCKQEELHVGHFSRCA